MKVRISVSLGAIALILTSCGGGSTESPASTASADVRRERFADEIKTEFERSVSELVYPRVSPNHPWIQNRVEGWLFAQQTCANADAGMTWEDWLQEEGIPLEGPMENEDQLVKVGVATLAVQIICPEHTLAFTSNGK